MLFVSFSFQPVLYSLHFEGEIKDIVHGVPWRLADDLAFIAYSKELVPLCQFLRKLAVDNGLSEVHVPDHQVKPRMVEASQPTSSLCNYQQLQNSCRRSQCCMNQAECRMVILKKCVLLPTKK